jgi:tetratricopeptide (TPR) repeat protein
MQPKPALTVLLVLALLLFFSGVAWQVRAQNPPDAAWFQQQGDRLFRARKLEPAAEAYQQAIKLEPHNAQAYAGLGFAYGAMGRYPQAVEAFKHAIRLQPNAPLAYGGLGTSYHMLRRYQESKDAFQQAIRLKPDFAEAHYGLGRTYLMLGNRDGAVAEYHVLKTLDPQSAAELWKNIPR